MTGQNTSSAVMQQRAATAPDELDYFPTPPWAGRALCEFLQGPDMPLTDLEGLDCWEPACGERTLVTGLADYFGHVRSSDVFPYTPGQLLCDFLIDGPTRGQSDWVITNPPFMLGQQFIETGLDRCRIGTAMLVRSAFLESDGRHTSLFTLNPPTFVCQFVERVVMLKGRLIQDGAPDPFNLDDKGRPKKAGSATAYTWLVWLKGAPADPRFRWIPKSRARLERPGDYPAYLEKWAELEAMAAAAVPPGSLLC